MDNIVPLHQILQIHDPRHTDGTVVVVHVKDIGTGIGPTNPAHAFGPFSSIQEAVEFEDETPEDHCHKIALDLIGPNDLTVERVHAALRLAGLVPPSGSRAMAEEIVRADRMNR